MNLRIAAVVVLFNPDKHVAENIYSYIDNVEQLYIVDNSEHYNSSLVDEFKVNSKVQYIDNGGNLGIARALNIGCAKAFQDGYNWLLTMDQDSKITGSMLPRMIEFLNVTRCGEVISIVSPYHANSYFPKTESKDIDNEIIVAMTSGNLLNLSAYKNIGPFKDDFFIDYVDNEYCLRSKLKGYKIIQVNNAVLEHNLGEITQHVLFGKVFYTTNHSALRLYYRTRNRFYLHYMYKDIFNTFIHIDKMNFLKEFIRIILFEDEKIKKTYYIILGYVHAKQRKLGKFNV